MCENHSIKELCDVYEVSRSGYCKWSNRKGQLNSYEKAQQELDYYVLDIHSHYPSQGYRSIADTLLNMYGWVVSDTIYYFNYVKPLRKLNKKPPVRYRIEQVA